MGKISILSKLNKKRLIPYLVLILIGIGFFYKFIFLGLLPFPGDLLLSNYAPWKTYSFFGYVPGSYPSKLQYFDVIRQLYPWRIFAMDMIKQESFPLWNPYNFSGHPLFANSQSAVLYPLNILYFLLSNPIAWSIQIMMQSILASIFTYIYCRRIKIGVLASIFSAIAFSYSLFFTVFLEYNTMLHVASLLPLILFGIEGTLKKINVIDALLIIIGLVSASFAGHIQIYLYVLGFSIIYAAFRSGFSKKRLIQLFIPIFLAIGISSIQLVPTAELLNLSARLPQTIDNLKENLLIQPSQLVLFISSDFYGNPATGNFTLSDSYPGNAIYIGIAAFIFAISAFFVKKKPRQIKLIVYASIVLIVLLTRNPISLFIYWISPLASLGSPSNAIFLLSFCLSIMAGWQMQNWIKSPNRIWIVSVTSIFILVLFWIFIPSDLISLNNIIYSFVVLSVVTFILYVSSVFNKRYFGALLLTGLLIVDLFYFFHKFNPFVPIEFVYPETNIVSYIKSNNRVDRYWGYGSAHIEPNFDIYNKIYSPEGYDPLYPKIYGEFLTSSYDGTISDELTLQTRSDAVIAPGYGEVNMVENTSRKRVLDLLGVSYILDRVDNASSEKTFPIESYSLVYKQDGWRVFENKAYLPRAFMVSDYDVINTKEAFSQRFFDPEFNPRDMLILSTNPSYIKSDCISETPGSVEVISYEPNMSIFKTYSECEELLFVSDTYFPGWQAYVDGSQTPIYRSFHAFRSIVVPKGTHEVQFTYKPQSFIYGIYLTMLSLTGALVYLFYVKKAN